MTPKPETTHTPRRFYSEQVSVCRFDVIERADDGEDYTMAETETKGDAIRIVRALNRHPYNAKAEGRR